MNLKAWQDLPLGGVNYDCGNSLKNRNDFPRPGIRPEFNAENCINCFFCWVFCPENAIILDSDQVKGINYEFCKGCGICANECPVQRDPEPLIIVRETSEM